MSDSNWNVFGDSFKKNISKDYDFTFIRKIYDSYSHASFSEILSAGIYVITILIIGSIPLVWSFKKGYLSAKNRFEEINPHLKGQYFSFFKWLCITNDSGNIKIKHYKEKFGEQSFTNTDNFLDTLRQFSEFTQNIGTNFSLLTRWLIFFLLVFLLIGIFFP